MTSTRNKAAANSATEDTDIVRLTFDQQCEIIRLKAEADERVAERAREAREAEREARVAERDAAEQAEERRTVRERKAREAERDAMDRQLELARLNQQNVRPPPVAQFRVHDAVRLLPQFDDKDIDLYLSNFEKIAQAQQWPREHWASVLTPMLRGSKALRALNRLTIAQVSVYDDFKEAILNEFDLVPEVYRARFRNCVKRATDNYADFGQFLSSQFERWIASVEADQDIQVLKNVMLIEQFMSKLPDELKQYLLDKNCRTLLECVRKADEYVSLHKNMRSNHQVNKTVNSHVNNNGKPNAVNLNNSAHHNANKSSASNDDRQFRLCYACHKPGHRSFECPNKPSISAERNVSGYEEIIMPMCHIQVLKSSSNIPVSKNNSSSSFIYPVCFYNTDSSKCVSAKCYRDSGTDVTLLMSNVVPNEFIKPLNKFVKLQFANGTRDTVPLCKVNIVTAGVQGNIVVGIVPNSYQFPRNASMVLGNDYGVRLTNCSMATRGQSTAIKELEPKVASLLDTPVPVDSDQLLKDKVSHLSIEQGTECSHHCDLIDSFPDVSSEKPECADAVAHKSRLKESAKPVYSRRVYTEQESLECINGMSGTTQQCCKQGYG
jgi:hypothetical protein